MGRYKNSGLFHGTNGNRQTSIEQTNYDGKLKNLSKKKTDKKGKKVRKKSLYSIKLAMLLLKVFLQEENFS